MNHQPVVPLMQTIAVASSIVLATMLVVAFVALMSRVVFALDATYGTPRIPFRRPRSAGPLHSWPNRPGAPDRALDRDWWPRFEREFADYVDSLG